MKSTIRPAARSTVVLEVELPPDDVRRTVQEAVRHLARRHRIPGFRPGKAPRPILERALGVRRDDPSAPNPFYDDAKEHLFEHSVLEAVREQDLDVISVRQPEWTRFEEDGGASFRVTLTLRPRVELGSYTDYPFTPQVEPVDDPKVDQVVEQLRDQQASLVPVEERAAQEGDWAVIGFRGTRAGEALEGLSAERLPLVIGQERMIPGFEAHIVGMREGEEKTFTIRFPDDYQEQSLAGQEAEFTVTLRELREKRLPPADDDFARSLGSYDDLAALRAEVRRRLEGNTLDRARHAFADRVIEYAVGNATVEVPDELVDREVEVMLDELKVRLAEQGIGYEQYLAVTERDEAKLREEYREPAEHRVKVLLVLEQVADREGVEVADADIEAEVRRARERYTENPKLVAYFESERGRRYLRDTMRRSRVVEQLVERWIAEHPEFQHIRHLEDEPGRDVSSDDVAAAGQDEPESVEGRRP